jgi:hypothetical protein
MSSGSWVMCLGKKGHIEDHKKGFSFCAIAAIIIPPAKVGEAASLISEYT